MVCVSLASVVHDSCQDSRLRSIKLLAGHVPRVAGVDLLAQGGALGHDLLDDIVAVHLHGGVVLLAGHLGLAHRREAVILLSWQAACLLENL